MLYDCDVVNIVKVVLCIPSTVRHSFLVPLAWFHLGILCLLFNDEKKIMPNK